MRILFLCEAVTLAHIIRPLRLAQGLTPGHDTANILLASTQLPTFLQSDIKGIPHRLIPGGISSEDFQKSIYKGEAIYTESVLESYIKEDCKIIEEFKPDVVLSDFRLSASISCKLKAVPLITLSNINWSPYAIQNMPAPETPALKILGVTLTGIIFKYAHPLFLAKIVSPMNSIRKKYGLFPFQNIFEMYTSGDYVAYLDPEGLIDHRALPENHIFLGPVLCSTPTAKPNWREEFIQAPQRILATLGSSGDIKNIDTIIEALGEMPVKAAVSTLSRAQLTNIPKNVFVENLLDLEDLLPQSHLFIGNGGSPTNYLALSQGVPIIGIPSNLDQYLTMQGIENSGSGIKLRSGTLTKKQIQTSVEKVLESGSYKSSALHFKKTIMSYDVHHELSVLLTKATKSIH